MANSYSYRHGKLKMRDEEINEGISQPPRKKKNTAKRCFRLKGEHQYEYTRDYLIGDAVIWKEYNCIGCHRKKIDYLRKDPLV